MGPVNEDDAAIDRGVVCPRWLQRSLQVITAVAIFAIASLTFVDVVMRYFVNQPLRGIYEMNALLLGLMTMSALPLVTIRREHITVDVLDGVYRGWLRYLMQLLVLIFQMIMIAFIAWRVFAIAAKEWNSGWVTIDLQISRAPLLFAMALLAALAAALAFIMVVQFLRRKLPVIPPGGFVNDGDKIL